MTMSMMSAMAKGAMNEKEFPLVGAESHRLRSRVIKKYLQNNTCFQIYAKCHAKQGEVITKNISPRVSGNVFCIGDFKASLFLRHRFRYKCLDRRIGSVFALRNTDRDRISDLALYEGDRGK